MKKLRMKLIVLTLLLFLIVLSDQKVAKAYQDEYTSVISLDKYWEDDADYFYMPKDGTIKVNITATDKGSVPGNLTFAIQTGYEEDSEKVKEITGITSSQGITDMEIDLKEGYYYLYFKLSTETGDLSATELDVNYVVDILPTIPENISELTVNTAESYDDITADDYDIIKFGDKYMDLVLPFTVDQAGAVFITMAENTGYYDSLTAKVYQDQDCKKAVGKAFTLKSYDDSVYSVIGLPAKGTYYIKFTFDYYSPEGVTDFKVKLYSISNEARTLTDTTMAYQDSDSSKITYKFTVKSAALVTFAIYPTDSDNAYKATVQLLNKDKKKMKKLDSIKSELNSSYDYDPMLQYYVLPKGTYYIQVDTSCGMYELDYIYTKVANQAGSSKTKATTLKVGGKEAAGYYTITDKTTSVDWFKFTVSSSQFIKITVTYILDGNLKYEILDSKGNVLYNSDKENKCLEGSYYYWLSDYFTKGTYYIKVYKTGDTSSASYSIELTKD